MTSVYLQFKARNVPMDNHESDLYVPVTSETTRILRASGRSYTVFTSQIDGKFWYDVPFAYEPFWERRQKTINADH